MAFSATRGRSLPCRMASLAHLEIAGSGPALRVTAVARASRSDCRSRFSTVTGSLEDWELGLHEMNDLPAPVSCGLAFLSEPHSSRLGREIKTYPKRPLLFTPSITASSRARAWCFQRGRPTGASRAEIRSRDDSAQGVRRSPSRPDLKHCCVWHRIQYKANQPEAALDNLSEVNAGEGALTASGIPYGLLAVARDAAF